MRIGGVMLWPLQWRCYDGLLYDHAAQNMRTERHFLGPLGMLFCVICLTFCFPLLVCLLCTTCLVYSIILTIATIIVAYTTK